MINFLTNSKGKYQYVQWCFALALFFSIPLTAIHAQSTIVISSPNTARSLSQYQLCALVLNQIAASKFTEISDLTNLRRIGVERHFGALLDILENELKLTFAQSQLVTARMKTLVTNARLGDSFFEHALAAMFRDLEKPGHGGVELWFCFGINCAAKSPETTEVNVPFNYTVRDFSQVPQGSDLSGQVAEQPHVIRHPTNPNNRIPHPNIGLSRVEAIFFNRPDFDSAQSIDLWLADIVRESSVYATHQVISEWISKNQLATQAGFQDGWFQSFVRLEDRVYVIDPLFYNLLMAGSKYIAQEGALKALGRFTPSTEKELRQKAYAQIKAQTSEAALAEFAAITGHAISEANVFEFTAAFFDHVTNFNQQIRIEQAQQVYPDPSLGIMPLGASVVSP